MVWTSSRGGHCGTGFFSSLLNMAADRGMAFWGKAERHQGGEHTCNTDMLSGWTMHLAHVDQKDEHTLKRDKCIQGPARASPASMKT